MVVGRYVFEETVGAIAGSRNSLGAGIARCKGGCICDTASSIETL